MVYRYHFSMLFYNIFYNIKFAYGFVMNCLTGCIIYRMNKMDTQDKVKVKIKEEGRQLVP